MVSECQITQLMIYPIKSLKGIAVEQAELTAKGFRYDRHWMIVNPKGQFLTQRQFPRMALIETELDNSGLTLSSNTMQESIFIPFDSTYSTKPVAARVWKNDVEVLDEGENVSRWLTKVLDTPWPVRLVKMAEHFERVVDQSEKLSQGNTQVVTEFADGFPYLVANRASLDYLNEKLNTPVPMDRFRPNIVIEGLSAFREHQVERLTGENIELHLRYPCERCVVTTIDQSSGEKDLTKEPLTTLTELNPMPDKLNAAAFGMNAELFAGKGALITVGFRFSAE